MAEGKTSWAAASPRPQRPPPDRPTSLDRSGHFTSATDDIESSASESSPDETEEDSSAKEVTMDTILGDVATRFKGESDEEYVGRAVKYLKNELKSAKEAAKVPLGHLARARSATVISSMSQPRLDVMGLVEDEEISNTQFYGKLVITAGTPDVLVDLLTWIPYVEADYYEQFLLTYRSFVSPVRLVEMIQQRLSSPDQKRARTTELRLLVLFKIWSEKIRHDLDDDDLQNALNGLLSKMDQFFASQLRQMITTRPAKPQFALYDPALATSKRASTEIPRKLSESALSAQSMDHFDDTAIALHLTQLTYEMFSSIPLSEFFAKVWNKKNPGPALSRMIQQFNIVSSHFAYEIVRHEQQLARENALRKVIRVAKKCLDLQNFESAHALAMALDSSSVGRLKKTWKAVSSDPSMEKIRLELAQMFNAEGNYATYRTTLSSAQAPAIPYIGIYLRDLLFIDEGNQNFTDEAAGVVNFSKRRLVAGLLMDMAKWKTSGFSMPSGVDQHISRWLLDMHEVPAGELYELSCTSEPKKGGSAISRSPRATLKKKNSKANLKPKHIKHIVGHNGENGAPRLTASVAFEEICADHVYMEFYKFLQTRLAGENLLFWRSVSIFKKENFDNQDDVRDKAGVIFTNFLAPDAPNELGISSFLIKSIKTALNSTTDITSTLFGKAIAEVENLVLRPSFQEWVKTLPPS